MYKKHVCLQTGLQRLRPTFSKASYWVGTGSGAQPEPENWPDESASASESMASAMSSGMAMGSIMGAMVGADEGPLAYATGQEQMHCSRTDSRSMSCSKSEGNMHSSKSKAGSSAYLQ